MINKLKQLIYKRDDDYAKEIVSAIQEQKEIGKNKKMFFELFMKFFDVRILPKHNSERVFAKMSMEDYMKTYVNETASRLKVDGLLLSDEEIKTPWHIDEKFVESKDGIKIKTCFIKTWIKEPINNKKWVVMVHGLNSHKFRALFYGLMYLRWGYNIVVFDLRNHGGSDKASTTLGENEKYDLKAVIDNLLDNYSPKEIAFHGWSMGTFAIVEYLKLNQTSNRLTKFTVLDSTIDRVDNLWNYMIKDYLKMSNFAGYNDLREYAIATRHYDPELINPGVGLESLRKIRFLYILNWKDKATPFKLGLNAYHSKIDNEHRRRSRLLEFDVEHARAIYEENEFYTKQVYNFIVNDKRWGARKNDK